MGDPVRPGVREAVEPILQGRRHILESGRDVHLDQSQMALPLSRRRQARQDRRLPAAPGPRYHRRTGVLSQGTRVEPAACPAKSDARRPRAESSRAVAAATRASVLAEREGAYQQVPQQPHRARPPRDQETLRVDGRVQVVGECGDHDRWRRTRPPDSQGTILLWPWPAAPRLVAEGGMGDGARIEEELAAQKGTTRTTEIPAMHQNQFSSTLRNRQPRYGVTQPITATSQSQSRLRSR